MPKGKLSCHSFPFFDVFCFFTLALYKNNIFTCQKALTINDFCGRMLHIYFFGGIMTKSEILMLIAIFAYMLFMLGVGILYSKRNRSTDEFYLGGRKLGPLVTAMSAEASDMSGWLLMGLPGLAYICGIAEASWTAIGLAVGTYLNWLIVAKRLRVYSEKSSSITVPDFFANRYRDTSKLLVTISAVIIIVFFVPYTASGFSACGKLFSTLFGLNYHVAMIISAAIIIAYTVIGGFFAASVTDLVQSVVMSLALVVVLVFGISQAGGVGAVVDNATGIADYISLTSFRNLFTNEVASYGFLPIVSTLAWGLGYFGMPHILVRFMAIGDVNKLKISRRVGTIWVIISMAVATIIGIVGMAMVENGSLTSLFAEATSAAEAASKSETIIIAISTLLSKNGVFAALVAGVIMAGILASTMSTADSQLLVASSSVSENIIKTHFLKNMSTKTQMWIARATVIIISAVAVVLAWNPNSSVFRIVSFAWAGFGAAFGPVVLSALFWRRSNKWGALAGMVAGGVMVFVWKFLVRPIGGAWDIYELLPAFIVSSIVIVVVSLLTKAPSKEIEEEFDAVRTGNVE